MDEIVRVVRAGRLWVVEVDGALEGRAYPTRGEAVDAADALEARRDEAELDASER